MNSVSEVGPSSTGNDEKGRMIIIEEAAMDILNISKDGASSPVSKPDSDAIKMFVGQIPRAWKEQEIIQLFQDFGPIHSINILRDKKSGESRGEN